MLAGTNLFFIASTFIPNPIYPSSPLLPPAALALGAINVNQLWVSGINFVKYSPEGFNTLKIFKVSCISAIHACTQVCSAKMCNMLVLLHCHSHSDCFGVLCVYSILLTCTLALSTDLCVLL